MKKRNLMKKVMVFGMSMMISVGCMSSVYAADDMLKCDTDISKIVTSEDAALIDAKISEINMYKHKIRMLEKDTNLNDEDRLTQIEEIQSKIEMIDKEIEDLGAERPSEELLEELITTSCGNTMARSVWHPSELIEQFDGGYDVRGYICFGENLEMQYHILFDHGGSDPYLFQEANVTLESDLSTKEDIAAAMEKTLSVYVGRVVGSMINNHTRVLKVLPWELLLEEDSDLENTIINKSDKIMKLEASIYTVVKFVYVYDKENDAWKFALSTNRVDYAYSLIIPVHKNSYTEQVVKTVNGLVANGKMGTSVEDASAAYKQNKSKNTCMNIFTIDYKDEMGDDDNGIEAGEIYKTSIYSPSLIVDMFYKK